VSQDHLSKLADAHWLVLRLDAAGLDTAVIARVLDIEIEAVKPLLEIARRKHALTGLDVKEQQ
jgi:hypothetical protein